MIAAAAAVAAVACAGCTEPREAAPKAAVRPSLVTIGDIPAVEGRPGERIEARVPVGIAAGYHVQANPAANEFLIPLALVLTEADGIAPGPPSYPEAHEHRIDGMVEPLLTYEGIVEVVAPLAVAPDADPGERALSGSLRYQACDDRRCFAPASLPVEVEVVVSR